MVMAAAAPLVLQVPKVLEHMRAVVPGAAGLLLRQATALRAVPEATEAVVVAAAQL